jgi:hypothetical protein
MGQVSAGGRNFHRAVHANFGLPAHFDEALQGLVVAGVHNPRIQWLLELTIKRNPEITEQHITAGAGRTGQHQRPGCPQESPCALELVSAL